MLLGPHAQGARDALPWRFQYDDQGLPTAIVDPGRRETTTRYDRYPQGGIATIDRRLPGGEIVRISRLSSRRSTASRAFDPHSLAARTDVAPEGTEP